MSPDWRVFAFLGAAMADLSVRYLPVDSLIPYARNSRTHSDAQVAQIAASIREFGFTNPVLVDADGGIIAGHGRVLAARKLKLDAVPTIALGHLTQTQRRAYVIADNKLALNAGWDEEALRAEFSELDAQGFDLDLTGFSDVELSGLMAEELPTGLTDDDAAPAPQDRAVSKRGDVWICGESRVMCGDATSITDVETLTGGALADMLLTDPPYNVAYTGKTKSALKIQNDEMDGDSFREFLAGAFIAAGASMKPGAVFYIWHADLEGYNFRGACRDAGLTVRQCLVWKKQTLVMGRQDYHWIHEPCLYGWKDGASHLWASDRKQTTVLEFDRPQRNDVHPTMKPVDLIAYQIQNNTKGRDVVLDLFGGSGTTLIAAEKTGRVAMLMEIDPVYADVTVRRWQEFTGKQAIHEATGATFAGVEADAAAAISEAA